MMRITKTQTKSKKNLLAIILLTCLVLTCGIYIYSNTRSDNQAETVDYKKPTSDQVQAGEHAKEEARNQQDTDTSEVNASKQTVPLSITAASQNGNIVQIRAFIEATSSDGNCTLTLSNGTTTVVKSSGTQALPSGSTCQGFDVPLSELGTGEWTADILFENNSVSGKSSSPLTLQGVVGE